MAGVTGLGKLLLVAFLTEDALLLKDKHGVLQLLLAAVADKMLGMPASTHGRCIWSPEKREQEDRVVSWGETRACFPPKI